MSPNRHRRSPDSAHLLGPDSDSDREVAVDRHVTLVVDHATDQATYRRDVVIFTPGVAGRSVDSSAR